MTRTEILKKVYSFFFVSLNRSRRVNTLLFEFSVNDFVLLLTGYRPNFEFLDNIGISLKDEDKKIPMYDENTMETNIPGIYLAGVICGGMETHKWFIENSRIHAKLIVADIIG